MFSTNFGKMGCIFALNKTFDGEHVVKLIVAI